jgi:hypothetical protein
MFRLREVVLKLWLLIMIVAGTVSAQTEFYFSSGRPILPDCVTEKLTGSVAVSMGTKLWIQGIVWNPDSLEWCTTKEGYYRSMDIAHPPVWKIDGVENLYATDLGNGFGLNIPVLDTLDHILSATYLDFPEVSLQFRGVNEHFPEVMYSGMQQLFSNDSIHVSVISEFPLSRDSTGLRTFREDSIRGNRVILTFDAPGDTALQLSGFTSGPIFKQMMYSPRLHSWSVSFNLNEINFLAKRSDVEYAVGDTVYDTVAAVFRKQTETDTIKTVFVSVSYLGYTGVQRNATAGVVRRDNQDILNWKMYDLRGRRIGNALSVHAARGIYLVKNGTGSMVPVQRNVLTR